MKSFKNYQTGETERNVKQNGETQSPPSEKKEERTAEQLTKKIAAAYNGKSNLSMMRDILAQAEKGKREGTLTNEEIEEFYKNFSPMLNGFQKRQLRNIVEKLKEI